MRRLSRLDGDAVEAFSRRHADSPLPRRLKANWLSNLARRQRWQTLVDAWDADLGGASTELQCHYLRALYRVGRRQEALDAVPALWTVGRSQPDACDPIFNTWIAAGRITPELAWQRMTSALEARQTSLASYLVRFLGAEGQTTGELYVRVHRHPSLLASHARFERDTPRMRELVAHGLTRWLRRDWQAAQPHLVHYLDQHDFSARKRAELRLVLTAEQAEDDALTALPDITRLPGDVDASLRAGTIRTLLQWLLRASDWDGITALGVQLTDVEQAEPVWRYWLGRAALARGVAIAPRTLTELARERHYYGFRAATVLGHEPDLGMESYAVDAQELERVDGLPGVQRAFELYVTNDMLNARREWHFLMNSLPRADKLAAAVLAHRWGWHRQAIAAAVSAEGWDDLAVRFPTAYREQIQRNALAQDLPPSWLFAMVRQESAFMSDARSPVGALGLMQLMPSTARRSARRLGLSLPKDGHQLVSQVLNELLNVRLGAAYLGEMYQRFGRSRILASAAYNAGPSRVERWLDRTPAVPTDVFIENITFAETRDYVQNVLVYAYIYNHFLGTPQPFLLPGEQ